MKGFN